jgi:transcriptional regulator with XRE-family HTH domain
LGNHLRKRRLDLALHQKDAAKRLGADETSVNNWEKNTKTTSLRFIPRIIAFLGYYPRNSEPRSLGERIVLTRRLLGLSQRKLARQLGVDPGTLGTWERNKAEPSEKLKRKLLAFFTSHLPSARNMP